MCPTRERYLCKYHANLSATLLHGPPLKRNGQAVSGQSRAGSPTASVYRFASLKASFSDDGRPCVEGE